MRFKRLLYMVFICASSCTNIGPTLLPPDRLSYNDSLQHSDTQQILMNIVRLRYTDIPYFLSVNNVVSQFSFTSTANMNVSNNPVPPPAFIASGDGGVSYSNSPTITYTPLQGTDFVTRLLTPIDLSVVYMLLRAGWSANHVLRVITQKLGPFENAILASRTTSSRLPIYKEFLEFGLILRKLQYMDGLLIEGAKSKAGDFQIKFTFSKYSALNARERKLLAKIHVTAKTPFFLLTGKESTAPNEFYIETRTVLGIFNYFSKSVDVPNDDHKKRYAPSTLDHQGNEFDWHNVTIGMMRVRNSQQVPIDAFVAVRYRQKWFYIAQNDFDSKESLNLLTIIMGIYQGEIKSFQPVFTVS